MTYNLIEKVTLKSWEVFIPGGMARPCGRTSRAGWMGPYPQPHAKRYTRCEILQKKTHLAHIMCEIMFGTNFLEKTCAIYVYIYIYIPYFQNENKVKSEICMFHFSLYVSFLDIYIYICIYMSSHQLYIHIFLYLNSYCFCISKSNTIRVWKNDVHYILIFSADGFP